MREENTSVWFEARGFCVHPVTYKEMDGYVAVHLRGQVSQDNKLKGHQIIDKN